MTVRRPGKPGIDDADDFESALQARRRLMPRFETPGDDEPPAALDRLVLARARDALHAKAPPERYYRGPRWAVPVALVATVLLSFGLVTQMDPARNDAVLPPAAPVAATNAAQEGARELAVTPSARTAGQRAEADRDAGGVAKESALTAERARLPTPAAATGASEAVPERDRRLPGPAVPSSAPVLAPAPAPASDSDSAGEASPPPSPPRPPPRSAPPSAERRTEAFAADPPAGANAAPSAQARVSDEAVDTVGAEQSQASRKAAPAGSAGAADAANTEGVAGVAGVAATTIPRDDPRRWLAEIERLQRIGELDAARAELADFRRRYPNVPLPASVERLR